jgi:hypothetical protein
MHARLPIALLAAAALAALPAAHAAQQPEDVPSDFRNGQENLLGRLELPPYLEIGREPRTVQVNLTLADLATVDRAATLMVAFNLKSRDVSLSGERLMAGDRELIPVKEETVRDGLQRQRFFDPSDVLASQQDGRVELTLVGTVAAKANGQFHVGALVIAFDEAWGTLRTEDGASAELYGFTLFSATGLPASALTPFHGQGNSPLGIALLALAAAVTLAGAWALASLLRSRRPAVAAALGASPGPLPSAAVATTTQADADAVPVFGSPAPPPVAARAPVAPPRVQGPRLPPGLAPGPWRPTPMVARPPSRARRPEAAPAGANRRGGQASR